MGIYHYLYDESNSQVTEIFHRTNLHLFIGQIIREDTHCHQLYCWDDLTLLLKTQPGAPALLGTRCDRGRICYKGRCRDRDSIEVTTTMTTPTNPSTISGVIENICNSVNTFVTSIINIFG